MQSLNDTQTPKVEQTVELRREHLRQVLPLLESDRPAHHSRVYVQMFPKRPPLPSVTATSHVGRCRKSPRTDSLTLFSTDDKLLQKTHYMKVL